MSEYTVAGKNYSSKQMDAFTQFHVARRLAPIVGSLLLMRDKLLAPQDIIGPLIEGLSQMKDEDCNFIIHKCLAVTQRQMEGGQAWGPVFNTGANRLMYEDIDMIAMLDITRHVIEDNLGNFMPTRQPQETGEAGTDQTSLK